MIAKIWTNEDIIIYLRRKYCGKGEIARYEQFLLFAQHFQQQSVVDVLKRVWSKGLNLGLKNSVNSIISSTHEILSAKMETLGDDK